MRSSFVTLSICACLALAAADVSHLSSSYLPPPKPEQVESMSIEQHELRELPEQVDYMRENLQANVETAPSSELMPPAMPEMQQMLAARYLPPAMPQAEQMPATRYMTAAEPIQRAEPEPEMMPEPAMEYMTPVEQQAAPAMRYLPPAQQQAEQYTYQQYQEQLQQEQQQQEQQQQEQQEQQQEQQQPEQQPEQQQQEQEMPYILDVQQPMAPSDAESLVYEQEPQPAHELRNDGYHYKQAAEEQRLRH